MRFDVITLFPEMLALVRDYGVTGRAHARGQWSLQGWNPRAFTDDTHQTVDDRPYGGGPGMVMMAEPLHRTVVAIKQARQDAEIPVILMSPAGQPWSQRQAQHWAQSQGAIVVCGRYEGIDQRFIDTHVTHKISLGDFVLSGGEIAALAVLDSIVRLLPGALGHMDSAAQDSFHPQIQGLLDSPHYTRPPQWQAQNVPPLLLSGDHAAIAQWRRQQSLIRSRALRPDLIEAARQQQGLSASDEAFLAQLAAQAGGSDPGPGSDEA